MFFTAIVQLDCISQMELHLLMLSWYTNKLMQSTPPLATLTQCYDGIRITRNAWDSSFCSVNSKFLAIVLEVAGGGAFTVINLENVSPCVPICYLFYEMCSPSYTCIEWTCPLQSRKRSFQPSCYTVVRINVYPRRLLFTNLIISCCLQLLCGIRVNSYFMALIYFILFYCIVSTRLVVWI